MKFILNNTLTLHLRPDSLGRLDFRGGQDRDDPSKQSPEVSQDFADIVPTGAENGEEGIADHPFQAAAGEASVGFHEDMGESW